MTRTTPQHLAELLQVAADAAEELGRGDLALMLRLDARLSSERQRTKEERTEMVLRWLRDVQVDVEPIARFCENYARLRRDLDFEDNPFEPDMYRRLIR